MPILATLRAQVTAQRLAQLAIAAEWLATIRTLAELYRPRAEGAAALTGDVALVWVSGALIALGFLAASTLAYFAGRPRLAGIGAIVMIGVLVVYKAVAIGI